MAIEWMETLEQRVREAADEIRRLRTENDALEERIETLERELAQAMSAPGATREPEAVEDTAWEQERAEVRSRVERLVHQLEGLIKEAEAVEA
jgi:FtsZ-binding cell division protein ZapB